MEAMGRRGAEQISSQPAHRRRERRAGPRRSRAENVYAIVKRDRARVKTDCARVKKLDARVRKLNARVESLPRA